MLSAASPSRGTVLVIDDEEGTGRLVRRHFPGWTVAQVFALTMAGDHLAATDLRLVLLDLNLADTVYPQPLVDNPFQGSFDLAQRIRTLRPSVPVVIFSADCNPAILHAARRAGARFVSKRDAGANLALLYRSLEAAVPT